jgi:uroporphyrinogen decarboxylase
MNGNIAKTPANCRERFLKTCRREAVDRPPMWMMRQAGRSLPEYRELKANRSFTELVQDPQTAAEVTLQPVRRFGYDAAIIFSDILVIPEAMGQSYRVLDKGGVSLDFAIESQADVDKLNVNAMSDKLAYTIDAIRITRKELGDETALIGFGGAPWTLATFMLEGGSVREYTRARSLFYRDRKLFDALMEKLTDATVVYLTAQIEAGVDAVQLFDSHAGMLSPNNFWEASGKWMKQVIDQLPKDTPKIVFGRGLHHNWNELVNTGADILGVDWLIELSKVNTLVPTTVGLQGNLDPAVLLAGPEAAAKETTRVLDQVNGRPGYVFNLGHGVPPTADIESIEAVTRTVKEYQWQA